MKTKTTSHNLVFTSGRISLLFALYKFLHWIPFMYKYIVLFLVFVINLLSSQQ